MIQVLLKMPRDATFMSIYSFSEQSYTWSSDFYKYTFHDHFVAMATVKMEIILWNIADI